MDNRNKILLRLFKDIEDRYNANSISKIIGISSMGALKILKDLEKKGIVNSEKFGKSFLYKINFDNDFSLDYLEFSLKSESEKSSGYVRRWINEIKKIDDVEISILFGSILTVNRKANDIDVLFVLKPHNFNKVKNEIEKLNQLNDKKIHPVYQTKEDFRKNLIKKDKVILESIKGIVVSGHKNFLNLMRKLK